jgi:ABC-type uncharacterized transport system substrate-binding protein
MNIARRKLLAALAGAAAWPIAARAQQPSSVPKIGFLTDESPSLGLAALKILATALKERGYAEGRNIVFERRYANGNDDLLPGLAAELVRMQVNVLLFTEQRKRVADLAIKYGLPTMLSRREHVEAGGLMSYGTSYSDMYRRAAIYVDKILKGANPSELPVEQPTTIELIINLKTAQSLGLTISRDFLLRADDLIE